MTLRIKPPIGCPVCVLEKIFSCWENEKKPLFVIPLKARHPQLISWSASDIQWRWPPIDLLNGKKNQKRHHRVEVTAVCRPLTAAFLFLCGCVTPLSSKGNGVRLCFPPDWEPNRWEEITLWCAAESLIYMLASRIGLDKKMTASLPELSCTFSWSDRDGGSPSAQGSWCCHSAPCWPTCSQASLQLHDDMWHYEAQHVPSFAQAATLPL